MNWEAIGAIGEIIGALAVVGSLIYLASQIRVSNKASRNSLNQEVMDQIFKLQTEIANSTEAAELFQRGMIDDPSLTDAEIIRHRLFLNQTAVAWERVYHLAKENEIDEWIARQYDYLRAKIVGAPGFHSWYEVRKGLLSSEFQKVIEQDMANAEKYDSLGVIRDNET